MQGFDCHGGKRSSSALVISGQLGQPTGQNSSCLRPKVGFKVHPSETFCKLWNAVERRVGNDFVSIILTPPLVFPAQS